MVKALVAALNKMQLTVLEPSQHALRSVALRSGVPFIGEVHICYSVRYITYVTVNVIITCVRSR